MNGNTHPFATGGKSQVPDYGISSLRRPGCCPCSIPNNAREYLRPFVPLGVRVDLASLGPNFRPSPLYELIGTTGRKLQFSDNGPREGKRRPGCCPLAVANNAREYLRPFVPARVDTTSLGLIFRPSSLDELVGTINEKVVFAQRHAPLLCHKPRALLL